MGTMFGEDNGEANDLYDMMKDIVSHRGLAYLIFYVGKCLEWISGHDG